MMAKFNACLTTINPNVPTLVAITRARTAVHAFFLIARIIMVFYANVNRPTMVSGVRIGSTAAESPLNMARVLGTTLDGILIAQRRNATLSYILVSICTP